MNGPGHPATGHDAWHDTLAAMTLVLQDCMLRNQAARSCEIDRAEAALCEYTRRMRRPGHHLAEAEL